MSSYVVCDYASHKMQEILKQLFDSGSSEQIGVADILNTIAENGDEQAEDEFLRGCAEQIRDAAQRVIDHLHVEQATDEPMTPESLSNLLCLVDIEVTEEFLKDWPQEWLETAANWAAMEHLKANDNDDVVVPEPPYYLPLSETELRMLEGPDLVDAWMTTPGRDTRFEIPSFFKLPDAKRVAWHKFKERLHLTTWTVTIPSSEE